MTWLMRRRAVALVRVRQQDWANKLSKDVAKRQTRRRHDAETTRAQILHAARELFSVDGYEGVSLRMITGAVGLDAAMVIRHFGSKDRLFAEAMRRPDLMQRVLSGGDRNRMGEKLARYSLSLDEKSREYHVLVALLRSASHKPAAGPLNEISAEAVKIVAEWLEGDNVETRAALICSHLTGIFILRSVFQNKALSSCEMEKVISRTAPIIQNLVDK